MESSAGLGGDDDGTHTAHWTGEGWTEVNGGALLHAFLVCLSSSLSCNFSVPCHAVTARVASIRWGRAGVCVFSAFPRSSCFVARRGEGPFLLIDYWSFFKGNIDCLKFCGICYSVLDFFFDFAEIN